MSVVVVIVLSITSKNISWFLFLPLIGLFIAMALAANGSLGTVSFMGQTLSLFQQLADVEQHGEESSDQIAKDGVPQPEAIHTPNTAAPTAPTFKINKKVAIPVAIVVELLALIGIGGGIAVTTLKSSRFSPMAVA